jgi:hypothetical protein
VATSPTGADHRGEAVPVHPAPVGVADGDPRVQADLEARAEQNLLRGADAREPAVLGRRVEVAGVQLLGTGQQHDLLHSGLGGGLGQRGGGGGGVRRGMDLEAKVVPGRLVLGRQRTTPAHVVFGGHAHLVLPAVSPERQ